MNGGVERGSVAFVRYLVERGYRHIFGLPGSSMVAPLYELKRTDVTFVPAIHESVAVAAADGYARVAGEAMVMLYMLPGVANGMANLYNAWRDESPLVVVSSQQASRHRTGSATIGEGDLLAMVQPFTRFRHELAPGMDVRFWLERARASATGRLPGPTFLSIPEDVLEEPGPAGAVSSMLMAASGTPDVERLAIELRAARRPLLMVGGQLRRFGGSHIVEALAERHGIALAYETGFPDRFGVAPGHPNCFGGISGATELEKSADVVIALGARFLLEAHPRESWFANARFIAQVNADPAKLAETKGVDWASACDPGALARALAACLDAAPPEASLLAERRSWLHGIRTEMAARPLDPMMQGYKAAVTPLHDAMDRGWVVDESVMAVAPLSRTLTARDGRRYVGTSGASLGWGTGAAAGVALASGEPVTCVLGDGALRFGALGLWTIQQQTLPVTLVVIDNGGFGSTRFFERQYVRRLGEQAGTQPAGYIGSDLRDAGSTVQGIIEGFRIPAETVRIGQNPRDAIERAWSSSASGPNAVVIEIPFGE